MNLKGDVVFLIIFLSLLGIRRNGGCPVIVTSATTATVFSQPILIL